MSDRVIDVGFLMFAGEGLAPGQVDPGASLMDFGRRAEEIGFDSLGVLDHLRWDLEWGPTGFWECTSIVAALAATTSRIRLTTSVLNAPFRNPGLVAKIAETIDMLSDGRFTLGLGSGGGPPVEYESFGFAHDHLYARFEEALTIIRNLLRTGETDFSGTYYRAPGCVLSPRGPRPHGLPIAIGAGGPKMMRLAARYADEWNGFNLQAPTPEAFAPVLAEVRNACADVGRDHETLRLSFDIVTAPTGDIHDMPPMLGTPLHGTAEEIADQFAAFASLGLDEIRTYLWPQSIEAMDAMIPVLAALDARDSVGTHRGVRV